MNMKSSAKKISLPTLDDIFQTDDSREELAREKVQEIAISELHSFENHPCIIRLGFRTLKSCE